MPSLADLARSRYGPDQGIGDIGAYREYVIACGERGKTPLPMPEWIKAGKPAG